MEIPHFHDWNKCVLELPEHYQSKMLLSCKFESFEQRDNCLIQLIFPFKTVTAHIISVTLQSPVKLFFMLQTAFKHEDLYFVLVMCI